MLLFITYQLRGLKEKKMRDNIPSKSIPTFNHAICSSTLHQIRKQIKSFKIISDDSIAEGVASSILTRCFWVVCSPLYATGLKVGGMEVSKCVWVTLCFAHTCFGPSRKAKSSELWWCMLCLLYSFDIKPHHILQPEEGEEEFKVFSSRSLRVKLLDETVKAMIIDANWNVDTITQFVCHKLGIPHSEEYSLAGENGMRYKLYMQDGVYTTPCHHQCYTMEQGMISNIFHSFEGRARMGNRSW